MISLISLWMPIVLSAVGVFFASSFIHMVLQWHKSEYRELPNETEVRAVVGSAQLAPGQYVMPHCTSGKAMQSPEMQQKFKEGPVAFLIVRANGMQNMGATLGQWFLLTLVIALMIAGLSCTVLGRGADAHVVFHFFAMVTFMTYVGGSVVSGIWMGKLWRAVAIDVVDSLIYAAVTGAVFAWLWPQ